MKSLNTNTGSFFCFHLAFLRDENNTVIIVPIFNTRRENILGVIFGKKYKIN